MKHYKENDILVICLEDRISSDNVDELEQEIRSLIATEAEYIFDAENLEYISSAGLRLLLKLKKEKGNELTVINVSSDIYEIFEMTGFSDILKLKKKMRQISIDNCEKIGEGAMGTVYRIDVDTIVKVYDNVEDIEAIEREVSKAKNAFLLGIPTAIPFDIVKVGDKYGAVFELIKAVNCNEYFTQHMEQTDEFCGKYAEFIKSVHGVSAIDNDLPRIKDMYLEHLAAIKDVLTESVYNNLLAEINGVPDDSSVIHGDIQLKNLMISDEELILIDMDTLSIGNPIFEFAGLYMTYIAFNKHEPDNTEKFLGIDGETANKLFYGTVKDYYSQLSEEEYNKVLEKITKLGIIRFLFLIYAVGIGLPKLRDVRIKYCVDALGE